MVYYLIDSTNDVSKLRSGFCGEIDVNKCAVVKLNRKLTLSKIWLRNITLVWYNSLEGAYKGEILYTLQLTIDKK